MADYDSDSEGEPCPDEAGQILFALLTDLKIRGTISATDACGLSYWIVLSGATHPSLKKLAKQPGDENTGRYSEHFDRATGMNLKDHNFATIDCPMYSQAEGIRIIRPLTVLPPQLTLECEVAARNDLGS